MMTSSPSDITLLASDLTDYLSDRGAWDVGSGGPDTVAEIAEFIANWTPCQRQQERGALRDVEADIKRLREMQDFGFRSRDISR
ncbi:MAG: hypothetical protein ACK4ZU_04045 [Allorhizobium sp.]